MALGALGAVAGGVAAPFLKNRGHQPAVDPAWNEPAPATTTAPAQAAATDAWGRDPGSPGYGSSTSDQFGSLSKGFQGAIADPTIDPGYEWRRNQGQRGLERAAAARGTLMTGGSLADIMDYNQGLASQEYANAWDRAYREWMGKAGIENTNRSTTIGAYQGIANMGLNAAGQYSNAANEAAYGGANATAAGQAATGRGWGEALGGIGDVAGDAAMWYGRYNAGQNATAADVARRMNTIQVPVNP